MTPRKPRAPLPLLVLLLAAVGPAPAAEKKIDFARDVYPILRARCFRCHKGPKPSSGQRLDHRSAWLGESDGRPLARPGASADSRAIRLVSGTLPDEVMPPPGRKPLTPEQVGTLRAWIDQGLAWDDKLLPPPPQPDHWAFRPVRRPPVPQVKDPSWVRNPIDAFLLARLEKAGLTPAPEADARTLIRRLSLDLTGLPPSPEEIEDFVRDPSPDAYEKLVDRLLASPAYGERWGRHWLDLARWADSEGYESNHLRRYAYRYRDYVIDAFNRDTPYPRFVRQQLAGDEMQPYADENLIATGFLAAARLSSNEEDKVRQRNDVLVDIVNATGQTFLGLTIHCCQCHDHKFDPIPTRDYYRLRAFFLPGQPADLTLRDPDLWATYCAARPPGYEEALRQKQALFEAARQSLIEKARKKLSPAMLRALAVPIDRRSPEEEKLARQADLAFQFTPNRIEKAIPDADRERYAALKKKLERMKKGMPDRPQTWGFYSPVTSPHKIDVLPMKGFYPLPFEPDTLAALRPRLLVRGDVHRPGPRVDAGWPAVFGPTPTRTAITASRLALADWIARPDNPLTGRVWVNRLWHYHFGTGLVATPSNFGTRGARPTHPDLLDWLATEFWRQGGRTKPLHRLLVTSAAYRQSSRHDEENARRDPTNALRWHWSPRRLEAEAVRDALLAISGELDRQAGGPGDEDAMSRRRTVYLLQKRDRPPEVQALFDGPSAATASCPRRQVSTAPLQALFLLNSGFSRDRARAFADRVRRTAGEDPARQAEVAFTLALGRPPDEDERADALAFLRAHALESFCQALFNVNEFAYPE
jgi:hypothetical protein